MANFPPLKQRFLLSLDRSFRSFPETGKFLDFGCGQGDVAEHLISKQGWQGDLYEVEVRAQEQLKQNSIFSNSTIFSYLQDVPDNSYDVIVAFDVLQHLRKAAEILDTLRDKLVEGGFLIMIVPYRAEIWDWDDDINGHLRRWSKQGVVDILESNQFEIIHLSDPTFPLYRFLRWAMLNLKQNPLKNKREGVDSTKQNLPSSLSIAWEDHPFYIKLLPWKTANRLGLYFSQFFKGDAIYSVSVKTKRSRLCDVCGDGRYSFSTFFGKFHLQICRSCGSRRLGPDKEVAGRKFPWLFNHLAHLRDILHFAPHAHSFLHVGCGRGKLLKELMALGWEVKGLEEDAQIKFYDEVPIENISLMELSENQKFDLIAFFGSLEFMDNIQEVLEATLRHLKPFGMIVLEVTDLRRPSKRLLQNLNQRMHLFNSQVLCDRLADRDCALIKKRKLSGGRLQLWFKYPGDQS